MVTPGRGVESQPESQPESLSQRVILLLEAQSRSKAEIAANLGQKTVSGQLNKVIRALLDQGAIEYTLPDKPNSRLQEYRLTEQRRAGRRNETGGDNV